MCRAIHNSLVLKWKHVNKLTNIQTEERERERERDLWYYNNYRQIIKPNKKLFQKIVQKICAGKLALRNHCNDSCLLTSVRQIHFYESPCNEWIILYHRQAGPDETLSTIFKCYNDYSSERYIYNLWVIFASLPKVLDKLHMSAIHFILLSEYVICWVRASLQVVIKSTFRINHLISALFVFLIRKKNQ